MLRDAGGMQLWAAGAILRRIARVVRTLRLGLGLGLGLGLAGLGLGLGLGLGVGLGLRLGLGSTGHDGVRSDLPEGKSPSWLHRTG